MSVPVVGRRSQRKGLQRESVYLAALSVQRTQPYALKTSPQQVWLRQWPPLQYRW